MSVDRSRAREWPTLTAGVIFIIQGALVASVLTSQSRANADFRALFAAGASVRSGHTHQLYDYAYEAGVQNAASGARAAALPFLYPPFAALLFATLAGFSYGMAFTVFASVNVACAVACTGLLIRMARLPRRDALLACACCLGFTPLGFAVLQGQVSVLLLLAFCLCQLALDRRNPFPAGLCLALTLVKFQIALPIALVFVLWRQWRFTLGFAAGAAALFCLSTAVSGFRGILDYGAALTEIAHHIAGGAAQTHYGIFPAKMPNLHGLSTLILGSGAAGVAVTAVLSIAILAWTATRKPSLPVAMLAALVVSYHLQPHDLTLLLLPLALSVRQLLEHSPSTPPPRAFRQTAWTALLILPPVYLVLEGTALMPLVSAPILLLLLSLAERREAGLNYAPMETAEVAQQAR